MGTTILSECNLLSSQSITEVQYAVTFNHWIVSGNTKSLCFKTPVGSFRVEFSDEQILYGARMLKEASRLHQQMLLPLVIIIFQSVPKSLW